MFGLRIKTLFLSLFYNVVYDITYQTPNGKTASCIQYNLSGVENFINKCKISNNKVLKIKLFLCDKEG